jgi:hypothetical protein
MSHYAYPAPSSSSSSLVSLDSDASPTSTPVKGNLGGKFFSTIGKSTRRRVEGMVIRRRVTNMRTKFPHDDSAKDMSQMYEDLLELARYITLSLRH